MGKLSLKHLMLQAHNRLKGINQSLRAYNLNHPLHTPSEDSSNTCEYLIVSTEKMGIAGTDSHISGPVQRGKRTLMYITPCLQELTLTERQGEVLLDKS